MAADYLFAVGRIKALEDTLLDATQWQRLSEADIPEGMKILEEAGYGADSEDKEDLESLISTEITDARTLIAEICPEPELSDLFLLPTDGHNIKVILKGILNRKASPELLLGGGSISLDVLDKSIDSGNYDAIPEALAKAIHKAENEEDPRVLSAIIDDGVYAQTLEVLEKKKNDLLSEYFNAKITFTNILTIVRCNILSWEQSKAKPLLLNGGNLDEKTLIDALGLAPEQLSAQLATGEYSPLIKERLDNYAQDKDITELEQGLENAALSIIHNARMDSFGIGPIINYLLSKLNEGRALRILFAAKRAGIKVPLSQLGVI
ncbi:V-type ATPase subunit [Eubacterium sp.]|uniref:V-type ATPase subunit n=1 Tax=Eubacterium sp. TaxID=142586 RepID=UPI002FCC723C